MKIRKSTAAEMKYLMLTAEIAKMADRHEEVLEELEDAVAENGDVYMMTLASLTTLRTLLNFATRLEMEERNGTLEIDDRRDDA